MIWVAAGIVGLGVLAAAAFAGLGRLGEMPQEPVIDRARGYVPAGPVTPELLAQLRLPTAASGYEQRTVDAHLEQIADGTAPFDQPPRFRVVKGGYEMGTVDELLDRERFERPTAAQGGSTLFTRPVDGDREAPAPATATGVFRRPTPLHQVTGDSARRRQTTADNSFSSEGWHRPAKAWPDTE